MYLDDHNTQLSLLAMEVVRSDDDGRVFLYEKGNAPVSFSPEEQYLLEEYVSTEFNKMMEFYNA